MEGLVRAWTYLPLWPSTARRCLPSVHQCRQRVRRMGLEEIEETRLLKNAGGRAALLKCDAHGQPKVTQALQLLCHLWGSCRRLPSMTLSSDQCVVAEQLWLAAAPGGHLPATAAQVGPLQYLQSPQLLQ